MYRAGSRSNLTVIEMFKTSYVINLTSQQRDLLNTIIAEGTESERIIRRAKILLLSDVNSKMHYYKTALATELNTSETTVQKVWTTYGRFGFDEALFGKERVVTHAKLNKDVRGKIRELAASQPPEGYKRWTYRLLCDEAIKRGIVESCSTYSMKQILLEQESIGSTLFRIHLSNSEITELQSIITKNQETERTILRAKILLTLHNNISSNLTEMAKVLNTTRQTIRTVFADYEARGAKDTAQRRARKGKFSEKQAQEIIRLLDEKPPNRRKWTVSALSKAAVEKGIVDSISSTAIQRILTTNKIVL